MTCVFCGRIHKHDGTINCSPMLSEQYQICELCSCPTQVLFREEIKGSDYRLCAQCREDNLWQIRDAIAEDMAGADSSERDQEEK